MRLNIAFAVLHNPRGSSRLQSQCRYSEACKAKAVNSRSIGALVRTNTSLSKEMLHYLVSGWSSPTCRTDRCQVLTLVYLVFTTQNTSNVQLAYPDPSLRVVGIERARGYVRVLKVSTDSGLVYTVSCWRP